MKHDHTKLDAAILSGIAAGKSDFTALCTRDEILEIVTPMAIGGTQPGWRFIDRRLQALRKSGQIEYRQARWHILNRDGSVA